MRRAVSPSLSPTLLAAVDITFGYVMYRYVSASIGLLLITAGLLVIVAALAEGVLAGHSPTPNEFEQATAE